MVKNSKFLGIVSKALRISKKQTINFLFFPVTYLSMRNFMTNKWSAVLEPFLLLPLQSFIRPSLTHFCSSLVFNILLNSLPRQELTATPRKLLVSDSSPHLWRGVRILLFHALGYIEQERIQLNNKSN